MDIKTWLVEMVVAACILAGAIVALTLMVGHTLWMRVARRYDRFSFRSATE